MHFLILGVLLWFSQVALVATPTLIHMPFDFTKLLDSVKAIQLIGGTFGVALLPKADVNPVTALKLEQETPVKERLLLFQTEFLLVLALLFVSVRLLVYILYRSALHQRVGGIGDVVAFKVKALHPWSLAEFDQTSLDYHVSSRMPQPTTIGRHSPAVPRQDDGGSNELRAIVGMLPSFQVSLDVTRPVDIDAPFEWQPLVLFSSFISSVENSTTSNVDHSAFPEVSYGPSVTTLHVEVIEEGSSTFIALNEISHHPGPIINRNLHHIPTPPTTPRNIRRIPSASTPITPLAAKLRTSSITAPLAFFIPTPPTTPSTKLTTSHIDSLSVVDPHKTGDPTTRSTVSGSFKAEVDQLVGEKRDCHALDSNPLSAGLPQAGGPAARGSKLPMSNAEDSTGALDVFRVATSIEPQKTGEDSLSAGLSTTDGPLVRSTDPGSSERDAKVRKADADPPLPAPRLGSLGASPRLSPIDCPCSLDLLSPHTAVDNGEARPEIGDDSVTKSVRDADYEADCEDFSDTDSVMGSDDDTPKPKSIPRSLLPYFTPRRPPKAKSVARPRVECCTSIDGSKVVVFRTKVSATTWQQEVAKIMRRRSQPASIG